MTSAQPIRPESRAIPERAGMSYREFAEEFLFPNRPVVLTDGLKQWKAVGKWTPEFFEARYQDMEVKIDGQSYSLKEFVQRVNASGPGSPAPYLRNRFMREIFPDLMEDLKPVPAFILPNWHRGPFYPSAGYRETEIYIGGTGAGLPFLHYDSNSTHAFLGQVFGEKEAVLFSPADTDFIYPKTGTFMRHHSFIKDVENPDLKQFPLFDRAVAHRGILKPGCLLFIPSRWWHTARMLSPSITISHNVANASNWALVADEVCFKARFKAPALAPFVAAYMKVIGWSHAAYDAIVPSSGTR